MFVCGCGSLNDLEVVMSMEQPFEPTFESETCPVSWIIPTSGRIGGHDYVGPGTVRRSDLQDLLHEKDRVIRTRLNF